MSDDSGEFFRFLLVFHGVVVWGFVATGERKSINSASAGFFGVIQYGRVKQQSTDTALTETIEQRLNELESKSSRAVASHREPLRTARQK